MRKGRGGRGVGEESPAGGGGGSEEDRGGAAELAAAHTQALESARLASGVAARLQLLSPPLASLSPPLASRGAEPQRGV